MNRNKAAFIFVFPGRSLHTGVRAGYEGKHTLVLMCMQALQGADHLTSVCCIHTADLQAVQVIAHVPAIKTLKLRGSSHHFLASLKQTSETKIKRHRDSERYLKCSCRDGDIPVQGFEVAHI